MKIVNRKARHNYHILETIEVGVVLSGPEVKSLRAGRADLSDSFARIQNGQVFLKNVYIPLTLPNQVYDPKQDRKLLLRRSQINALSGKVSQSATTLVPLSIYTTRNMFKVELALVASKKKYDKRKAIKERDQQRKLEQEIRNLNLDLK